jgi:hypothetical protein
MRTALVCDRRRGLLVEARVICGGVKGGTAYGATDELGYRIARDPVRVKDFQATVLHLLGLDHLRLGYMHAGLNHRLTGVQGDARVIPGLLA